MLIYYIDYMARNFYILLLKYFKGQYMDKLVFKLRLINLLAQLQQVRLDLGQRCTNYFPGRPSVFFFHYGL